MEEYFSNIRKEIVGIDYKFKSPYGIKPLIYCDWTATGRLYRPIENKITNTFGPMNGNTHSLSSKVGEFMCKSYEESQNIIKTSVGGNNNNIVLSCGGGMTGAIYKLINILDLPKYNRQHKKSAVVFISHLEHNSNYLPWIYSGCNVVIVPSNSIGEISRSRFEYELKKHKNNPYKIVSITACSNVTGCKTNYMDIANLSHKYGSLCFVDFATIAPYGDIKINFNEGYLDGIFFFRA